MKSVLAIAIAVALSGCTPAAINAWGAYLGAVNGEPAYYQPSSSFNYQQWELNDSIQSIRDQLWQQQLDAQSDRSMQQFRDDAQTMSDYLDRQQDNVDRIVP
jgi:hypothetical protein